jgi:DNA-binding LacI/PurR family transcriptional regulator
MGQEAVAMLLRRLAEPDLAPRRLVLGSHLIIRASSAVRGHDA